MRFESDPLVTLNGWTCAIDRGVYPNGSIGLQLIDALTAEPIAKATCAIDILPPTGCVWIKDWAENQGMLTALVNAGVIAPEIVASKKLAHVIVTAHKLLLKEQP